jgi:two-component system sensor histidine kinase PilS (NtrC family)
MAAAAIMLPLVSTFITAVLVSLSVTLLWLYPLWLDAESTRALLAAFDLSQHGNSMAQIASYTAAIFMSMLITHSIAERGRHSERLAQQRADELLDLAQVNQAIVQHLQSGVIVVDRSAKVRLLNSTAREQLNCHDGDDDEPLPLGMVSPALSQRWAHWLNSGLNDAQPFRPADHLPETTPYFSYLGDHQKLGDTLIVLEDTDQVEQRVQRIKLVALGRLTASIAHEIRNPLSSISHASQLLNESPTAGDSDQRLAQIIHNNAKRANTIITNVLDLSRRERAQLETIQLHPWLENFCNEFLRGYQDVPPHIEVRVQPKGLSVLFDNGHLHQIVWNLVSNACLHGTLPDTQPQVYLQAYFDAQRQRPLLDVIDAGPGIPKADQGKIFEPFFTSKTRGNGLGLYISREICEANRSQLQYLRAAGGGSCFRIVFGNHRNAHSQILNVTQDLSN